MADSDGRAPNWERWLSAGPLTLEQCVALSLGEDPAWVQTITTEGGDLPTRAEYEAAMRGDSRPTPGRVTVRWAHATLREPGRSRLQVLREACATGSLASEVIRTDSAGLRLGLAALARFAIWSGWEPLPAPLARLGAPVSMLSRQAMVSKHLRTWPTIERQLSEASRNGLAKAAQVKRGRWDEAAALAWADERGLRTGAATAPIPTLARRHQIS